MKRPMRERIDAYYATLAELPLRTQATDATSRPLPLDAALGGAMEQMHAVHSAGNKLMFIGNGGSAGIASHMAIDYSKNGNLRSLAFNDGAALTCLGNDLGYPQVFARQIALHARQGDVLVAISSSGRSENILAAVDAARSAGCWILTLSGFGADNPLRRLGDLNLYAPNSEYGFVEITHLALLHAILDLHLGWAPPETVILEIP
ncbi:SIS domain-containing protein [Azospirillum sp. Sh1]|uniref:SIS domain-containing protein n=1 Tax=Azospirillum sp. Sh1 TaxID=2607285 RepID=UPI0011ED2E13|nr:SIS domain-containing protein [Azospirillum sp. Sh1]KAA0579323.1 SIS domain-containing protein [Azospirillum sp. Sh1]